MDVFFMVMLSSFDNAKQSRCRCQTFSNAD